jgi:hypothetical protein
MPMPDLEPAAAELSQLVMAVPDEMLRRPTPCPAYSLGDLIDHVGGLAAVHGFLVQSRAAETDENALFGPVVPVPAERPLFDQVIGLAGRDPGWRPPASAQAGPAR